MRRALVLTAAWAMAVAASAAAGMSRPFVLWNKDDIAAIRNRIETQPWAKSIYEQHAAKPPDLEKDLFDLLRYAVMRDAEAGRRQKEKLLRMVGSKPPQGGAQWLNVVRYDLLYDELSAEQRQLTEKVFRDYIETAIFTSAVIDGTHGFNDSAKYSRYDARLYTRSNWLPNIIFPRKLSANLMAAALGDEALIRRVFGAYGSLQWYIDEYLGDSGFYSEEFSKMGATPGEWLLYCRAVERLGLNELGFGYVGRGGASIRGHIESLIRLGYPRVDLCSSRPHYPMLTMGDLRRAGSSARYRHPTHAFQHSLVYGFMPGGQGGNIRWIAPGAWGGEIRGNHPQWDGYGNFTPKMLHPLWFEIAHQKWPETGFGYFLAQMRSPGEDRYYPSLYFGLDPIDPASVRPPPAMSYVAPQRGIVMLRHDESPAYWESRAPAAAMRLPSPYAHSVNDALTICGYYALNRPMLLNRQVTPSYATGWSRSVLSHNGLMVDGREPAFTDAFTARHGFFPTVKFAASTSQKVYPGFDVSRALMLTRGYLLDFTAVSAADGAEHEYTWLAHALGVADADDARWSAPRKLEQRLSPFGAARQSSGADALRLRIVQRCALKDPSRAALPAEWYARGAGLVIHMPAHAATTYLLADTPAADTPETAPSIDERPDEYEVGGVSLLALRRATATVFTAMYEPFDRDEPAGRNVVRLAEGSDHVAVRIDAPGGGRDYAMYQWADRPRPAEVADGEQRLVFAGYAFVRVEGERVEAWGDVRHARLKPAGPGAVFILNNRLTRSEMEGGMLVFGRAPAAPATQGGK